MKNININKFYLVFLVFFLLFNIKFNAYGIDTTSKIELRNSYKQFENCMEGNKNDITECIQEFNKTFDIHKKVLKSEPSNADIKNTLLILVNSLNDIAETYYSNAEKNKGSDPILSKKYYKKASICFKQLSNLYPHKIEFTKKIESSNYFANYEEVEEHIFELRDRKRLDYALLSLQKLDTSRNSFNRLYGQNDKLNNDMYQIVDQLEDKINCLFQSSIEEMKSGELDILIYLIQSQLTIVNFNNKDKYKKNLAKMEDKLIGIIRNTVTNYKADFINADSHFKQGNYASSGNSFKQLLLKIEQFPDYSSTRPELKERISVALNHFNIKEFKNEVSQKKLLAKNTADFLSFIESGKIAFNQQNWIEANNIFKKANEFEKDKELAVTKGISNEWLNKVQKKVDSLTNDNIDNIELAKLHYKPMSYYDWLKLAKDGEFSKKYVSLSGVFQQKVDKVVILKNPTLRFDFLLDTVFLGEEMNSAGLIFKKDRFFKEGNYIECIGTLDDIKKFETILGKEIQLPIFKVVWSSN